MTREEATAAIVQVSVHGPECWLWRWEKCLDSGSLFPEGLILRVRQKGRSRI